MLRVSLLLLLANAAGALNNTQGMTPPMGFNPWTAFRANFNASVLLEIADAMIKRGLVDAGYKYMNLDCGWTTGHRDYSTGELQTNAQKFPDGMAAFGEELHSRSMLFGMYAGGWQAQCCHRGGGNDTSWQHWDVDAATFKRWNIDYLKSDPCAGNIKNRGHIFDEYNAQWDAAFRRIDYLDSVFIQGSGPTRATNSSEWVAQLNSWRTTADVKPSFESVLKNIHDNDKYANLSAPGAWNDADMLQCGQPGIGLAQCRTMLSLWSAAKSPLLIGADVRGFPDDVVALLVNAEVIAVNQDALGEQARWVSTNKTSNSQVWSGRLSHGKFVVVLVNLDANMTHSVAATWSGVLPGNVSSTASFSVRDVWAHEDLGAHEGSITLDVGAEDSRMLVLSPPGARSA